MNNVEINNIRNDSKSSLYYNNSAIDNSIVSHLSSIEHSLPSQLSPRQTLKNLRQSIA